jgi:hypothetical protein
LIRYSISCCSYHAFLDRGLLLARFLLNQTFLVVKLKSSRLTFTEYPCLTVTSFLFTCKKILNDQRKGTNNDLQILHRKLKIEQYEPHSELGMNSGAPVGTQFLLHIWHSSCYSCCKPGYKWWMRKEADCDYKKRNISVVISNTDIP